MPNRQTGPPSEVARTLVCAREDGEPKKPDSFTSWFIHLICRLRDFPRIRFHDLRHTHATQLLAAGVHPKVVQERLGHSSISVTMDVYSHVTPGLQADAVAKLDSAFGDQNRDHSRVERG